MDTIKHLAEEYWKAYEVRNYYEANSINDQIAEHNRWQREVEEQIIQLGRKLYELKANVSRTLSF